MLDMQAKQEQEEVNQLEAARALLDRLQRVADDQEMVLPHAATAHVAIIGLGYVGIPLAVGFASDAPVTGFDISASKIRDLNNGIDSTGEADAVEFAQAKINFTTSADELKNADVLIVCVPTPVNAHNKPDYSPLIAASRLVGEHMKKGAVVVFESTVDPGTTEGKCLPVIERVSGMKEGEDFFLGYSPERINPGDMTRRLPDIKKIVAGSSQMVTDFLEQLYSRVIKAGVHKAPSIKVAEAAKILENTQRDINIALMNQMMMLFDKMGIRSTDVIAAAGSKWNFHHYRPGLVGGHCIAVDPYFLVDAGRRHGLPMELVSAARAVNENTANFMVEKLDQLFELRGQNLSGSRVLVLGRSFKEDCADTRNSKAFKMMDAIWAAGADVDCYDPVAEDDHFEGGRGARMIDDPFSEQPYDAIIMTLRHKVFIEQFPLEAIAGLCKQFGPFIDLRGVYKDEATGDHFTYWRP